MNKYIDKRLEHLTEDEIQDVIYFYENTSIPVKEIIDTYKINIPTSRLVYILPPEQTKIYCPYCDKAMFKKRKSRSIDNSFKQDVVECLVCGHVMYENKHIVEIECNCIKCKEKERQDRTIKRNIIKEVYGELGGKKKIEEIEFEDISKLIYLISYYKKNIGFELNPVINVYRGNYDLIDIVYDLLDNKVLTISPNTDIDAFYEEDFPEKPKVPRASYMINIDVERIEDIYSYLRNNESLVVMKIKLLKQYIFKDVINNMGIMMRERKLEFEVNKKGKSRLEKLIDITSYTVIINFCLRVARFYSDKVITGEANRVVVQKCALSTVLTFYENAKRNNWSMVEADYNEYAGERLKNYITRVLGKKLNLLKYVASIDNLDMVVDYD